MFRITVIVSIVFWITQLGAQEVGEVVRPYDEPRILNPGLACGPYCLAFINSRLGGKQSYEEVARLCPPGPNGTNLAEIQSAARRLGLHSAGIRVGLDQLKKYSLPTIVHLKQNQGLDHFVAIVSWDESGRSALVFSPPNVVQYVPKAEIEKSYSGVALVLSSTDIPESLTSDSSIPAYAWIPCIIVFATAVRWGYRLIVGRGASEEPRDRHGKTVDVSSVAMLTFVAVAAWGCRGDQNRTAPAAENNLPASGIVDFGELLEVPELSHVFTLRNDGTEAFEITKIDKSCSCQYVGIAVGDKVAPGASLSIPFKVPTKSTYGAVAGTMTLETSSADPELQKRRFGLKAQLRPILRAIPAQVIFGSIVDGDVAATRRIRVQSAVPRLLEKLKEVLTTSDGIEATVVDKRPDEVVIEIAISPEMFKGTLEGYVVARFDDAEHPELKVEVRAQKIGSISIVPSQVTLSPFIGEAVQFRHVKLKSNLKQPFKIVGVVCPENIQIDPFSMASELAFDLRLAIARPEHGVIEQEISIETDQKKMVPLKVRFSSTP